MSPDEYLAIPEAYGRRLGGLRWGEDGDVVEHVADDPEIGLAFAMTAEVALFLQGTTDGGGLPHFAFALYFLHLLGFGARHGGKGVPVHEDLARAFRETGRSLHNAGVLCAFACRDLPRVADPPNARLLQIRLEDRGSNVFRGLQRNPGEAPPIAPEEFDTRIRQLLRAWSLDDLRHWLRHGRGPIPSEGEEVARLLPIPLAQALSAVEDRPRLRGMASLVPRFNGALSLPPRSLAHADLPLGGYTDVTNRGLPEQILPSQLALDPDEFLRRFAARELLYYHREEPHAPTARELVIVIDQGVRTWGDVRLALAAAAVALARQADRKTLAIRLATTGNGGAPVEAAELDVETLGALLESSDLSPNPADALTNTIAARTEPRDLIVLTHPRNLAEPAVAAAARETADDDRLFAVSIDADGEVVLSEFRGTGPVAIGRCRIDLGNLPAAEEAAAVPSVSEEPGAWRGDVEAIGFPFAIGALAPFSDAHFAFDNAGFRLLLAGRHGLLHAWRTDGSEAEMLPRAVFEGHVLDHVSDVIEGVAGGFVVVGTAGEHYVVAHYDWQRRVCKANQVHPALGVPLRWKYLRQFHTLVGATTLHVVAAIDLAATDAPVDRPWGLPNTTRAGQAREWASQYFCHAKPVLPVQVGSFEAPVIRLSPETGEIRIHFAGGMGSLHLPLSEGHPRLAGAKLIHSQSIPGILALLVEMPDGRRSIHVFEAGDSWRFITEYVCPRDLAKFAVSREGRRIAWRVNERQLTVRDIGEVGPPALTTPKGRTHPGLGVALGHGFLAIHAGRHSHLVRWDRGRLEFFRSGADVDALVRRTFDGDPFRVAARSAPPGRPFVYSNGRRFSLCANTPELTAVVDQFGQIIILDSSGEVVCMFLVFRDQIAAWAPDGSRVGPVSMHGRPPTPGGEERIAAAIARAAETWRNLAR